MSAFDHTTTVQEVASTLQSSIASKNVLITGVAPNALGAVVVRALAPYANTIIIATRTLSRAEQVIGPLRGQSKADFKLVELDLASFASIEKAAKEINGFSIPLHVVINNAALVIPETLTKTGEGFEAQLGINHLGHMLFNSLIFPSVKLAATNDYHPRIVAVSSRAHFWASLRLDDPNYEKRPEEYTQLGAYGFTKLSNTLFAREFARRYKDAGFRAYSVHPGTIRSTNMGKFAQDSFLIDFGLLNKDGSLTEAGKHEIKSEDQGAAGIVYAAFDPSLDEHSGAYIHNTRVETSEELVSGLVNDENALKVWEFSEELIKRKF